MFIRPCPTRTTAPSPPPPPRASAWAVRNDAAFAARSRASRKLSTPAGQPQNHPRRASPAQIQGGRRTPDRNVLGNSASRKHGSISGAVDGARRWAESRDLRSGLVIRHCAARLSRSSSAFAREDGSSGAFASPRSHSPSACPGIGVRKSHASLPCRARMIFITQPA